MASDAPVATTPQDRFFDGPDGLKLYYREHPAQGGDGVPVICLPGLTRNHRDFDELANHISSSTGRRVLSPDLRGRGRSEYDPEAKRYQPTTYVGDVVALLEAADAPRVVVVGTSLGGLLAMLLSATQPDRVAGVVLNDIGPEIDPTGLARIQGYVGGGASFASWQEASDAVRAQNVAAFPELDDEDWLAFAHRTCVEDEDGTVRLDYDPRIAEPFSETGGATPAADMWPLWSALSEIPALAIRGETSDILAPATFDRMASEKPDLERVTVRGVGHAPLLSEPECIVAIDALLDVVD